MYYAIISDDNIQEGTGNDIGDSFAIINLSDHFYGTGFGDVTITINNQEVGTFECPYYYWVDYERFEVIAPYTISLLPYGDIYGGEYSIEANYHDRYGYFPLLVDTVLEYRPVETRLNTDSLIINVLDDDLFLLIDGQEVELSSARQYALQRLDHDYTVTAQVGVYILPEWGDEWWTWSKETNILVPAKQFGDLNGDNSVDVSDGSMLINIVLGKSTGTAYVGNADMNADGELDVSDVSILIKQVLGSN